MDARAAPHRSVFMRTTSSRLTVCAATRACSSTISCAAPPQRPPVTARPARRRGRASAGPAARRLSGAGQKAPRFVPPASASAAAESAAPCTHHAATKGRAGISHHSARRPASVEKREATQPHCSMGPCLAPVGATHCSFLGRGGRRACSVAANCSCFARVSAWRSASLRARAALWPCRPPRQQPQVCFVQCTMLCTPRTPHQQPPAAHLHAAQLLRQVPSAQAARTLARASLPASGNRCKQTGGCQARLPVPPPGFGLGRRVSGVPGCRVAPAGCPAAAQTWCGRRRARRAARARRPAPTARRAAPRSRRAAAPLPARAGPPLSHPFCMHPRPMHCMCSARPA